MSVFQEPSFDRHEQVVFCQDAEEGLKAIIAVHNTRLGPALGGCRFWPYKSDDEALTDVLRLSRGMTYKAAITGLKLGGGKAVIIGDPEKLKSESFFRSFGRFVNSLGGRYITAEDVNMTVSDVEIIAKETKWATGVSSGSGDPSPVTALGVYHGIRAAIRHRLGREDMRGLRIGVQGLGNVGSYLCSYLAKEGAHLVVSDIREERVRDTVQKYGAESSSFDRILFENVDLLAPCALGGILNDESIPDIQAKIVAGAANNQLLDEKKHGAALRKREILYAPDYVINAGGLINVYHELSTYNREAVIKKVEEIYGTLIGIFKLSDQLEIPTQSAANQIAEERFMARPETSSLEPSFVKV